MKRIAMGIAAAAVLFGASDVSAQDFQVVVHADAGLTEISSSDLSNIFQKKARNLPSGEGANPVDQDDDAPVRDAFSQAVHGRSGKAMAAYWQQQIFSGKDFPPEQKDSDDEVLAYIARTPGAVGYVSASATLGAGVKAITVSD